MFISLIVLVGSVAVVGLGGLAAFGLYYKLTNVKCKSKRRLEGKTAVVTGGTAGMGLEIATELARRGAKVIIACPFQREGADAAERIVQTTANKDVTFRLLDLSSFASVREFAAGVLGACDRLDILVNNAGVLAPDVLTKDGINFIMQVNYFGHFLLTLLLLPLLRKTGKPSERSRIVNTSSGSHSLGKIDFDNITRAGAYRFRFRNYANSKLCIALFTRELARRVAVAVHTADPGVAVTQIGARSRHMAALRVLLARCYPTAREGAQTALHVALDASPANGAGLYFRNCRVAEPGKNVSDDATCRRLWDESIRLVQLHEDEFRGV